VKSFSEEEETAKAVELMNQHVSGRSTLFTTPLLVCELANALRHKPAFNKDKVKDAINSYYGLHLHEAPIDAQLLSRSTEIAFKGGVTIYDAVPVALADIKDITCVTADEDTQYAKLKPRGYPIELLH